VTYVKNSNCNTPPIGNNRINRNNPDDVDNGIDKNTTKGNCNSNTSMVENNYHNSNTAIETIEQSDNTNNTHGTEGYGNVIVAEETVTKNKQYGTQSETSKAYGGLQIRYTFGGENNGNIRKISQSGYNSIKPGTEGYDNTTTNEDIAINRNTTEEDGKLSIASGGVHCGKTPDGGTNGNTTAVEGSVCIVPGDDVDERPDIAVEQPVEDYENAHLELNITENDFTGPMPIVHIRSLKLGNVS